MNDDEVKQEVLVLLKKYNDILVHSASIAVTEDFLNLVIVNGDDKDFNFSALVKDQQEFRRFVTKNFFKNNHGSMLKELADMPEDFMSSFQKRRTEANKQIRLDL